MLTSASRTDFLLIKPSCRRASAFAEAVTVRIATANLRIGNAAGHGRDITGIPIIR